MLDGSTPVETAEAILTGFHAQSRDGQRVVVTTNHNAADGGHTADTDTDAETSVPGRVKPYTRKHYALWLLSYAGGRTRNDAVTAAEIADSDYNELGHQKEQFSTDLSSLYREDGLVCRGDATRGHTGKWAYEYWLSKVGLQELRRLPDVTIGEMKSDFSFGVAAATE